MPIAAVRPDEATATELDLGDRQFVLRDYFGSFQERRDGIQGFEVNLTTPHGVIPPHFHEVDQYQVVIGGSGSLGKHELPIGAVHYTDRYTPYGPIRAGEEGLSFFTLRLEPVVGSHYMPESRALKTERSGHTFTGVANIELPVTESAVVELGSTPDGAAATEVRVAPGDEPGLDTGGLHPGYHLVMAGSLRGSGRELGARSCLYVDTSATGMGLAAGPEGAVVVQLRFRTVP